MSVPRFTLVLPAGGRSVRFGSDKLLADLAGEPVIARTLAAFVGHPGLAAVVVATAQPDAIRRACEKPLADAAARRLPVTFVAGGPTRAESVGNAVAAAPADVEWVAVHDAARPLVSPGLIDAVLAAAVGHGAAAPAVAVALTIKQTAGPLPAAVVRTLPRAALFALQTPQVARRADLLDALGRCPLPPAEVTDDLQLIELVGGPTWLIPGEERNLKLTTAGDLAVAERLLRSPS